jgi:siroheme synthase-like protein
MLGEALATYVDSGRFSWIPENFVTGHLEGTFLAVAATNDDRINAEIVSKAIDLGVLVCDASSAARSQIIFGAVHRNEEDVTVAVFTDGRDPSEARRTRDRIAALMTGSTLDAKNRSGPT